MTDSIVTPRRSAASIVRRLFAGFAALGLASVAQAQTTNVISSASFSGIQTAMNQGSPVVVQLKFNDTVSMDSIIEVTSDTTLDATGFNVVLQGGSTGGI